MLNGNATRGANKAKGLRLPQLKNKGLLRHIFGKSGPIVLDIILIFVLSNQVLPLIAYLISVVSYQRLESNLLHFNGALAPHLKKTRHSCAPYLGKKRPIAITFPNRELTKPYFIDLLALHRFQIKWLFTAIFSLPKFQS